MASTVSNISNAVTPFGSLRFASPDGTATLQFCESRYFMAAISNSLIIVFASQKLYYKVSVSLRSPSSAAYGYAYAAPQYLCAISLSHRSRFQRRYTHCRTSGNKLPRHSLRSMARNCRPFSGRLLGR